MNNATARLVKAVVGLVIVSVLLIVVSNWWREYKSAASRMPSRPTTGTADASGTAAGSREGTVGASAKTAVVLIEGLNFRKKADPTSDTIRGLKKGEKVTIILTNGDWYQVRDARNVVGWIVTKSQYVRVER